MILYMSLARTTVRHISTDRVNSDHATERTRRDTRAVATTASAPIVQLVQACSKCCYTGGDYIVQAALLLFT